MTKLEKVIELEKQIKEIFNKDFINAIDCIKGKALINQWKTLTGWIEDKTPVLKGGMEDMF